MTNPLRGQFEVELGGESYNTRLTIDACIKVESEIGMSLLKLTQKIADSDVRIDEVIVILTHALRGGGNKVEHKDVKKIVQNAGLTQGIMAVANILTATLSDPDPDEDQIKKEKKERNDAIFRLLRAHDLWN